MSTIYGNNEPNVSTRRTFLKCAGAAAIGGGFATRTTALGENVAEQPLQAPRDVTVRVEAPADPLITRTFAIFKDRVQHRCPTRVVRTDTNPDIILTVDNRLPTDAYRIDTASSAIRLAGGSPRGLLYGVGKFLRTSRYDGSLQPSPWRGTSEPHGSLRGMYFATHFHNWYHQASEAEIARYIEDLALWGVNAVMTAFPAINLHDWNDPQTEPAIAMLRKYAKLAHQLGLQYATGMGNTWFIDAPRSIRAGRLADPLGRRGNSGHPICPSNPEGHAYIMANTRRLLEKLSDVGLDVLCFWPYDEGGCSCQKCMPWGSNGYLKLSREQTQLGRTIFPNLKAVLSTWMFDTPPEGEWQGLTDALAKDNTWPDYILADAHEDFPRYPLDSGVPGRLPLLNFPEISMWGNWPWGGFGANPLPSRFQRLWDQVKQVVRGGFPYSEGIYEDINKAVVVQFYWDRNRPARAMLEEYIAYEFGPGVTQDVLTVIDLLEASASSSYRKQPVDTTSVRRASQLADAVNTRLPAWGRQNWRWEIVHLRALLDRERFAGGGLQTPVAEAAMTRLIEIYHCQMETDDPYHHRVRPPHRRALSRRGQS